MNTKALDAKSLVLGSVLLLAGAPAAATIVYDEGVSGDIGFDQDTPLIVFGNGANDIVGTDSVGDIFSDQDNFSFVIPVGAELVGITYSFGNLVTQGAIQRVHKEWQIRTSTNFDVTSPQEIDIMAGLNPGPSPVSFFDADLPIGEGTYKWLVRGYGWSGTVNTTDQVDWDYVLTFHVRGVGTVPEPATLALLGLGLAGLGLRRRKGT